MEAGKSTQISTEITDTLNEMNIIVNIRHTARYPFSNLWLFVNTTNPEGVQSQDTLECVLQQKMEGGLASGLGDIWDIQIPLKTQSFSSPGEYVFEIEQAMRMEIKRGLSSYQKYECWFRIEKKNRCLSLSEQKSPLYGSFNEPVCCFSNSSLLDFNRFFGQLPTFEQLENPKNSLATEIISEDGKVLGKYFYENRSNIKYEDLPQNLINALIATEDVRFRRHTGIDVRAL